MVSQSGAWKAHRQDHVRPRTVVMNLQKEVEKKAEEDRKAAADKD